MPFGRLVFRLLCSLLGLVHGLCVEDRPSFIKHYTEIQKSDDAHYPNSDELLSIGSPFSHEEEFVYVISGRPDAWIDGHIYPLREGDGVGFPAGTGIAHTFINNTEETVRLLVVGEATKKENKVGYPINPEENERINYLWKDAPKRDLGPHDGLPDALRSQKR